ncbi:MAG: SGNH/GDSL hydrolase family protein [Acidimicrobiales bacterium]
MLGSQPVPPLLVAGLLVIATACGSDHETGARDPVETSTSDAPATTPATTVTTPAPTTTDPADRSVLYLGDSITVQASDALRSATEGRVEILAETGARTIDLVDRAARAAEGKPDIVVFNVGTNDEACITVGGCSDGYLPTPDELALELEGLAALFPEACRVGVTITFGLDVPPIVNPTLHLMAEEGSLDSVADWAAHRLDAEPDDDPWLTDFMGHLSPSGATALAALITTQVDETCR